MVYGLNDGAADRELSQISRADPTQAAHPISGNPSRSLFNVIG
jgi:hypothetical protein